MRRTVWLALFAIVAVAVVFAFRFQSSPVKFDRATVTLNPSLQSVTTGATVAPTVRASSGKGTTAAGSTASSPLHPSSGMLAVADSESAPSLATGDARQRQAAANDTGLLAVKGMLRDYRATMSENPVGNNSEITKALLGGNRRGADFGNSQMKLDKDGQLIDRWNHPYFFHQLSKIDMEVRSAGPDGMMWTSDDEVSP